ncbi:MAG: VPLPA-CTERM sorting domain-containing protein [Gammaproteobacteria bacterium]|nr:VPLPA-CTERM sorting domain-containing protein [Gammaproteobacteria bacterium]NNF62170.1 VPLPA-CTERM sorting domain-containing protein [Gammaproteobacteria bacterium]NNM20147.1 VPLPA-CTERM sorting domain-containing protein [Gammaproteobacteria bacterium]
MVRKLSFSAFWATILLAFSINAHGAPLALTMADTPDIAVGFITVEYAGGSLSANGFALSFDGSDTDPALDIVNGLFTLNAQIDSAGNLASGSLVVSGTIGSQYSGTLLTGDLTAFGFNDNPAGDPLEFLFSVTGGELASLYGAVGGIILASSGFSGSFTHFSSTSGTADVAAIPVPAAVWLMLTALAGLSGFRNR